MIVSSLDGMNTNLDIPENTSLGQKSLPTDERLSPDDRLLLIVPARTITTTTITLITTATRPGTVAAARESSRRREGAVSIADGPALW
jgi:hypothetical protein